MKTPQEFAEAFYAARGQSVQLLPFFYCTSFTFSPNGTVPVPLTQVIATDRDSDFVWCDIRAVVSLFDNIEPTDPTQLLTDTKCALSISIGETGRQMTEQSGTTQQPGITLGDLSGWADRPFVLYEPLIITARTVIYVTLSSTTTITAVDVALHGMKAVPGSL